MSNPSDIPSTIPSDIPSDDDISDKSDNLSQLFSTHKSTLACKYCGRVGTFKAIHADGRTYCTGEKCNKRPSIKSLLYESKITRTKDRKPYASTSPPPTSPPPNDDILTARILELEKKLSTQSEQIRNLYDIVDVIGAELSILNKNK
jgi:hypothetical protein